MRILVADDDLTSRHMLSAVLKKAGHEIVEAIDGAQAWQELQKDDAPHLVILDWIMPELDGPEVLRKVRSLPTSQPPYIIMLTNKTEKSAIIAGLEAGANDYLAKPFDHGELKARIEVGRRMIELQEAVVASHDKLSHYAQEMESLAADRARQLVHADRMATLGTLSAGIAHEINNPTTFIAGNTQTLERSWNIILERLSHCGNALQDETISFVITEVPKMLAGIRKGVDRITAIVGGLKNYARQDIGEYKPFDIDEVIEDSIALCNNLLKYKIVVEKHIDQDLPKILGNSRKIEQVLVNLLTNAADSMQAMEKGTIIIHTHQVQNQIYVHVQDTGPGLKEEAIQRMFDPFYTTKAEGKGTGLGLSISLGIIQEHGGALTGHNVAQGGAEFVFWLPVIQN